MLKYASSRRILSTAIAATSSRAGSGGLSKEYDIRDGWIITTELDTFSLFNSIRKYAVSSGLLLNTCIRNSYWLRLNRYVDNSTTYEMIIIHHHLYKLWSSKVKHELRKDCESCIETKWCRIILPIVTKPWRQPDEQPIQPSCCIKFLLVENIHTSWENTCWKYYQPFLRATLRPSNNCWNACLCRNHYMLPQSPFYVMLTELK